MKHKEPNLTQLISPLPPPRGMVPLQGWGPSGVNKLGGLDPHVIKPVPWEHSNLGPLRQGLPQPAPPTSPKMGQSGYLSLVDGESACERPRTPEPPRASHDVGGDQSLHSPPFQSFKRIPMEGVHDKGMGYGSLGPPHGPLAHANGQALLKSMVSKNVSHIEKGHKYYSLYLQKNTMLVIRLLFLVSKDCKWSVFESSWEK